MEFAQPGIHTLKSRSDMLSKAKLQNDYTATSTNVHRNANIGAQQVHCEG